MYFIQEAIIIGEMKGDYTKESCTENMQIFEFSVIKLHSRKLKIGFSAITYINSWKESLCR